MPIVPRTLVTTALLLTTAASIAAAQSSSSSSTHDSRFGLRAGAGFTPSQFVVGASMNLGKSLGIFRLSPVAQVGFGDNTTFDINLDFLLRLRAEDSGFGFYGGAAPTVVFASDTYFGGTIIAGVNVPLFKGHESAIEGRIGIGDVPDFRLLLTVGL